MAQISRDLRNENRIRIFELLQTAGPISRAELSRRTGISGPTVMRIIDEFFELGIVSETMLQEKTLGRRPVGISLRPDFAYTVAILHEGDWIQAGLLDMTGRFCVTKTVRAEQNFEMLIRRQIPELVDGMMQKMNLDPKVLTGIGIGLPAVLDPYEKLVYHAPLIGVTQTVDISQWLDEIAQRYNTTVTVENDVNVLAMGEHTARQLEDRADMAYVALGTGVGSGMILRGKLRRGRNNMAGELGSIQIWREDGPQELEHLIGREGLERRFGVTLSENLSDEQKHDIIEYVADTFSPALLNFATCLDLDLIVLGGFTVNILGKELVDAIAQRVTKYCKLPISIELGISQNPGIEGLSDLMRNRLNRQMGKYGLDIFGKMNPTEGR